MNNKVILRNVNGKVLFGSLLFGSLFIREFVIIVELLVVCHRACVLCGVVPIVGY